MPKLQSYKHNAKTAAKAVVNKFWGLLEVIEPIEVEGGFIAAVRIKDGVSPASISPEVLERCHVELPEGWTVVDGVIVEANPFASMAASVYAKRADVTEATVFDGDEGAHHDFAREVEADIVKALMPLVGKPLTESTIEEAGTIAENVMLDHLLSGVKAGSKEAQVFAMLRKPEGATVAAIAAVMGWEPHTTRAYISVRVRKRGVASITEIVEGRGRVYRIGLIKTEAAA